MESTQEEIFALAHWSRLAGSYPGLVFRLCRRFGSAAAALQAPAIAWRELAGFPESIERRVADAAEWRETERELAAAKQAGITLCTMADPQFPASLREIEFPPALLYLQGRRELLGQSARQRIAIVGSRTPSSYGRAQASRFAAALAAAGRTIVSGLARGIDETAHRACLEAGGDTIAILGSGLLSGYPPHEPGFLRQMRERGLLISEFPLHASGHRHHFPWRNRLLAGLCQTVLVVEAAAKSGSLITAHWAIDQGKDLWAVPGRVDNPMSSGCHALLRESASLALEPADLLGANKDSGETTQESLPPLLQEMGTNMRTVDELCALTKRAPESVLSELLEWEVAGLVVRGPGGLYRLNSSLCR